MQALDIIHRAVVKSGVSSSFNPDEMPGEYEYNGRRALESDVIVGINCDRTLDITETAVTFECKNGKVKLCTIPTSMNIVIVGETEYTSDELLNGIQHRLSHPSWEVQQFALRENGIEDEYNYPTDDLNVALVTGIWTSDNRLFVFKQYPKEGIEGHVDARVNLRFPPMDVIAVYEDSNRREYIWVDRKEFESAEFCNNDSIYTTELYEDSLVVLFHSKVNTKKRIVLPVPISIENTPEFRNPNDGVIHAPAKFEQYLVYQTAVCLAQQYGMPTLENLSILAQQSYNRLLKNSNHRHGQNIRKEIRETIRGGGRVFR